MRAVIERHELYGLASTLHDSPGCQIRIHSPREVLEKLSERFRQERYRAVKGAKKFYSSSSCHDEDSMALVFYGWIPIGPAYTLIRKIGYEVLGEDFEQLERQIKLDRMPARPA